MGFAGAHCRGELTALTLAEVTLHSTDGLHVRLRTSKTDQEARGTVKALPYGRDPVTGPHSLLRALVGCSLLGLGGSRETA